MEESESLIDIEEGGTYGAAGTTTLSASSSLSSLPHSSSYGVLLPPPHSPSYLPLNRSGSLSSELSLRSTTNATISSNGGYYDPDTSDRDVDAARVYQAAAEAGRHAFGIVGVDVWILNHGRFLHAPGGLWVSRIFRKRHASDALDRILNPHHAHYAAPVPQVPGAGLAGYFWSMGAGAASGSRRPLEEDAPLLWRDLHAITSDPFQPPYKRMQVLEEAGFGKATGVPFDVLGHRGVVIYLARQSADETLLHAPPNLRFLKFASQHIGSCSAMSHPRQVAVQAKEERVTRRSRRLSLKLDCLNAFTALHKSVSAKSLRSLGSRSSSASQRSGLKPSKSLHRLLGNHIDTLSQRIHSGSKTAGYIILQRLELVVEKSQGGNLKPPPPAPLWNAVWTFMGAFFSLLVLVGLSLLLHHWTGDGIVLAPFGALLTLQFSLTAAPASQPRNVIYGQMISLSIALLSNSYLRPIFPMWLLLPLTAAASIATMSKLGCTHPPAAAAVVALFSEPSFSVYTALFLLLGNLAAVATAIVANNLSDQRQYPVYWEFGIREALESLGILRRRHPARDLEFRRAGSLSR